MTGRQGNANRNHDERAVASRLAARRHRKPADRGAGEPVRERGLGRRGGCKPGGPHGGSVEAPRGGELGHPITQWPRSRVCPAEVKPWGRPAAWPCPRVAKKLPEAGTTALGGGTGGLGSRLRLMSSPRLTAQGPPPGHGGSEALAHLLTRCDPARRRAGLRTAQDPASEREGDSHGVARAPRPPRLSRTAPHPSSPRREGQTRPCCLTGPSRTSQELRHEEGVLTRKMLRGEGRRHSRFLRGPEAPALRVPSCFVT